MNKFIVKGKFPILLIDDLLEELVDAIIFSKIHIKSGYHQIKMSREDVHKTTFKTHNGCYEFIIMPFGLTNALITFQILMNELFGVYIGKFILVLFDDILIYNSIMTEHL